VLHLHDVRHYSDERIAATSREEAQERLNAYYSRELSDPPSDP
jgi:hypothetical protein